MKRFDLITEADARLLDIGATVELAAGGHVTPLARDTLAARRVTIVAAGSIDSSLPADLAPAADIRRIVIGCDHTGAENQTGADRASPRRAHWPCWTWARQGTEPVDYPDIAAAVALSVARGESDAGIVIDGAGIGSAIAANKVRGIRAAMCVTETIARYSREHNGANVMTLGSSLLDGPDAAIRIVDTWIGTAMREARYIRRLLKIRRLEERFARD